jgi:hypothetical protein
MSRRQDFRGEGMKQNAGEACRENIWHSHSRMMVKVEKDAIQS